MRRSRLIGALLATVLVVAGAAACSKDKSSWNGEGGKESDKAVELTVTPAEGATDVPVSAEIGVKAPDGGQVTGVTLTDNAGGAVKGAMRADGTSWVPDSPLKYTTTYKAVVEGKDAKGRTGSKTVTFGTMARPGNRMEAQIFMADNITTYGQAMPIVVEFKQGGVKGKEQRATVERLGDEVSDDWIYGLIESAAAQGKAGFSQYWTGDVPARTRSTRRWLA